MRFRLICRALIQSMRPVAYAIADVFYTSLALFISFVALMESTCHGIRLLPYQSFRSLTADFTGICRPGFFKNDSLAMIRQS